MGDSAPELIHEGSTIAQYEVTRLIGRGMSSTVWAARSRDLPEKEVAIKILSLDPRQHLSAYARLRREAQILLKVPEEHIVSIYALGELPGGAPYMVLELLSGKPLSERLRDGPFEVREALEIAMQIGSALNAAHQRGILHRDLKPSNIFIRPTTPPNPIRYHVKVIDFGIAVDGFDTIADSEQVAGSTRYMAPEQLRAGPAPVDQRADLFSFAVVLYEMLSGRPPFSGDRLVEIADKIVHEVPEPIDRIAHGIPPRVARALDRALEKDPARRFRTVTDFTSALTGTKTFASAPRVSQRSTWRAAALAVVAIFAIASLTAMLARWWDLSKAPTAHASIDWARASEPNPNSVAVLDFENQLRNDTENDWCPEALPTAFSTALNRIPQLQVKAPIVVREIVKQTGWTTVEAARQLGVAKVIDGTCLVRGGEIRIDARITDTASGDLIASEWVKGPKDGFLDLQNKLALMILSHFQVELPEEQREKLTEKTRARTRIYQRLLAAEGVLAPANETREPHSSLPRKLGRFVDWFAAAAVPAAQAQDVAPEIERGVLATLEDYRAAHESGALERLERLYVSFPENQRRAVLDYRSHVSHLQVGISDVKILPRETDVVVSYTRCDRFTDNETGEEVSMDVRLTKVMVFRDGTWKFTGDR